MDLPVPTVKKKEKKCHRRAELVSNLQPFFKCFIYFWLHWVFVAAHGLTLVALCGLPIEVPSLVAEHRL